MHQGSAKGPGGEESTFQGFTLSSLFDKFLFYFSRRHKEAFWMIPLVFFLRLDDLSSAALASSTTLIPCLVFLSPWG